MDPCAQSQHDGVADGVNAQLLIVKIGGGAEMNLAGIADGLTAIHTPVVVVHGANALRDEIAKAMQIERREITSIKGYTSVFTDAPMIDAMMASYSGIRNKRIVELCQQRGVNAVGLSGLDGRIVQGKRNPGIRTIQDGKKILLRDQSGKPRSINVSLLRMLLADGYTPVLAPPIVDEDGAAINTENDDIVALLARELNATRVVSFIEAPGILRDIADAQSVIPQVAVEELEALESRVDGRMRRKVKALRAMFSEPYHARLQVVLADGRAADPLGQALAGHGTIVGEASSVNAETPRPSPTRAAELQQRFELDVYGKRGPTLVSGSGTIVRDETGREYIDCIAGHGAVILGHCHPAIVSAITRQASRLGTCPGSFYNDARAHYLEALIGAAPAGLHRAFLCNSGTEAVEAAIKFARLHTGRAEIVAMTGAFHGRTFGAMSVSSSKEMRDPFKPLVPGVTHVGFNDFEALAGAIDNQTAAVILELVQGEGGVHPADPGFVSHARKLCDHHGALLVVDEVQTGFGRTGKLFALEHHAIRADIVCVAKGMAGGFPMGAVLVNESIQVGVGLHGSTFGGHPVACAAAAATLQVLLSGTILESVSAKGDRIVDALGTANLPIVREIRHLGLMIGIETRVRARPILIDLAERGVLALPAGSRVVRLLPPLTISNDEIDRVVDAVVSGRRQ